MVVTTVPVRYRTRGHNSCLYLVLQGGILKDEERIFRDCLKGGLRLICLAISTFSFANLCIITSRASLRLCYSMSLTLDAFRCMLVTNLVALCWTISS